MAGEVISGRGESKHLDGGNGEQPYADQHIIHLVNDTCRLEHLLEYASRAEMILRAGERISGRGEAKSSGGGKN